MSSKGDNGQDSDGGKIYYIKCQHCGQVSLVTPLNWRTIAYGLILLSGEEDGYIGITCPNEECLRVILVKESLDTLKILREDLFEEAEYGPGYIRPLMRYRSFPYGLDYPAQLVPHRLDFEQREITDTLQSMGEEELWPTLSKWNRTGFRGLYLPYSFGDLAMGPAIYVPLLLENGIEEIVKYENEKKLKVFPRYTVCEKAIEDIERFCYSYFIEEDYAEKIRENCPNVVLIEEAGSSYSRKQVDRSHMFFQVLTTPGDQTRKIYERLRSGMEGLEKEISSTNTMEHEVADYYKSGLGKDFLEEKYSDFIQDFMAISGRLDFTARVVEILRENYLTQLHQQMHTEFLGTKQYAFFEEPPTWTIIFDGKRIPNLTGKGFQYIHFLISRPREQFSVFDLAKLTDEHEVVQASTVDHGVDKDQDEDETYFHEKDGERSEDRQHLQSLRIELAFIEDQLQGASGYSGPHVDKDKLESDKQFIEKEINRVKSCIRYGEKQDGENSENTRLKNRITKRIERAVKDIRKANPKAADHFERALRPINSYEQRYNLNENIRWYLE